MLGLLLCVAVRGGVVLVRRGGIPPLHMGAQIVGRGFRVERAVIELREVRDGIDGVRSGPRACLLSSWDGTYVLSPHDRT